jgi:hypothetical protein
VRIEHGREAGEVLLHHFDERPIGGAEAEAGAWRRFRGRELKLLQRERSKRHGVVAYGGPLARGSGSACVDEALGKPADPNAIFDSSARGRGAVSPVEATG